MDHSCLEEESRLPGLELTEAPFPVVVHFTVRALWTIPTLATTVRRFPLSAANPVFSNKWLHIVIE